MIPPPPPPLPSHKEAILDAFNPSPRSGLVDYQFEVATYSREWRKVKMWRKWFRYFYASRTRRLELAVALINWNADIAKFKKIETLCKTLTISRRARPPAYPPLVVKNLAHKPQSTSRKRCSWDEMITRRAKAAQKAFENSVLLGRPGDMSMFFSTTKSKVVRRLPDRSSMPTYLRFQHKIDLQARSDKTGIFQGGIFEFKAHHIQSGTQDIDDLFEREGPPKLWTDVEGDIPGVAGDGDDTDTGDDDNCNPNLYTPRPQLERPAPLRRHQPGPPSTQNDKLFTASFIARFAGLGREEESTSDEDKENNATTPAPMHNPQATSFTTQKPTSSSDEHNFLSSSFISRFAAHGIEEQMVNNEDAGFCSAPGMPGLESYQVPQPQFIQSPLFEAPHPESQQSQSIYQQANTEVASPGSPYWYPGNQPTEPLYNVNAWEQINYGYQPPAQETEDVQQPWVQLNQHSTQHEQFYHNGDTSCVFEDVLWAQQRQILQSQQEAQIKEAAYLSEMQNLEGAFNFWRSATESVQDQTIPPTTNIPALQDNSDIASSIPAQKKQDSLDSKVKFFNMLERIPHTRRDTFQYASARSRGTIGTTYLTRNLNPRPEVHVPRVIYPQPNPSRATPASFPPTDSVNAAVNARHPIEEGRRSEKQAAQIITSSERLRSVEPVRVHESSTTGIKSSPGKPQQPAPASSLKAPEKCPEIPYPMPKVSIPTSSLGKRRREEAPPSSQSCSPPACPLPVEFCEDEPSPSKRLRATGPNRRPAMAAVKRLCSTGKTSKEKKSRFCRSFLAVVDFLSSWSTLTPPRS